MRMFSLKISGCLFLLLVLVNISCNRVRGRRIYKPVKHGIIDEVAILPVSWPIQELQLPPNSKKHLLPRILQSTPFDIMDENVKVNEGIKGHEMRAWAVGFHTGLSWDEMIEYSWVALKPLGYSKGELQGHKGRLGTYFRFQDFDNANGNIVTLSYNFSPGSLDEPTRDGYCWHIFIPDAMSYTPGSK